MAKAGEIYLSQARADEINARLKDRVYGESLENAPFVHAGDRVQLNEASDGYPKFIAITHYENSVERTVFFPAEGDYSCDILEFTVKNGVKFPTEDIGSVSCMYARDIYDLTKMWVDKSSRGYELGDKVEVGIPAYMFPTYSEGNVSGFPDSCIGDKVQVTLKGGQIVCLPREQVMPYEDFIGLMEFTRVSRKP